MANVTKRLATPKLALGQHAQCNDGKNGNGGNRHLFAELRGQTGMGKMADGGVWHG